MDCVVLLFIPPWFGLFLNPTSVFIGIEMNEQENDYHVARIRCRLEGFHFTCLKFTLPIVPHHFWELEVDKFRSKARKHRLCFGKVFMSGTNM